MKSETNDFDAVLKEVGSFGKYQKINFFLLSFVFAYTAMPLAFIFTTRSSNYRCYIDGCDPPNINEAKYDVPWLKNAIPFQYSKPLLCQRYEDNFQIKNFKNRDYNCNESYFNDKLITKCDKLVFENGDATMERDFNLTCMENMWKLSFIGSMGDFSEILGLPLIGYISDRYGRLNVMIIGCVLSGILGTSKSLLSTYEQYITFEAIETLIGAGIFSGAYVLAIELVTPKHRVLCSSILICMFSLGEAYLCLIAWLTQSWRTMLQIIYLPSILFLTYYFFLNESIRWLLVKGKIEEAKNVLVKVAETNGVSITDKVLNKINNAVDKVEDGSHESILKLFHSKTLCGRFISCAFVWLTCTFVFYGFNMKSVMISGNLYVNYLLSVLIEIPANFICYWLLNDGRRKPVLCYSLLFTGVLCFVLMVIPFGNHEVFIFILGKCCITISLSSMYVYVAEVFPTSVRHSLLACCSIFGRLGGMAAPQIPLMAQISPCFIYLVFMCMTIISSILILPFPESLHSKLPDTLNEAVVIGHKTMQ